MEHRLGQRFVVDIPIHLTLPLLGEVRGRLTNLSLSGAFISTQVNIRVMSRLQVYIEIPGDASPDAVSIAAHVIRKTDHGVGIEWYDFAPAAVAALLRDPTLSVLQRDRRRAARVPAVTIEAIPPAAPARRLKHGS
jgi:uncharacterized membrane protein